MRGLFRQGSEGLFKLLHVQQPFRNIVRWQRDARCVLSNSDNFSEALAIPFELFYEICTEKTRRDSYAVNRK